MSAARLSSGNVLPMRVADAHLDVLLEVAHRRYALGETGIFEKRWLPSFEAGQVVLQICPVFVDPDLGPDPALREAVRQISCFHEIARTSHGRVIPVSGQSDLISLERDGKLGILLALEGAEPLGCDLPIVDLLVELGLRMAALTWNRRNAFADGTDGDAGLTPLGAELVDRLVSHRVVIDLAHASPRTFTEVLERVGTAPVIVSHAGCRSIHDHPRNLSDTQLRALAEAGGMFCMMLAPIAIDATRPTIERACEHMEHAARVMGVDRIGLGADFARPVAAALPAIPSTPGHPAPAIEAVVPGLEGPEHYPRLQHVLTARGWSNADVEAVMGRNLLRFLGGAL